MLVLLICANNICVVENNLVTETKGEEGKQLGLSRLG